MSSSRTKDREQKIQGYVAAYYKWALQQVVDRGFEGVSLSDAVSNIVQRWMDEHADDHRQYGITKEAFLKARTLSTDSEPESQAKGKLFRFERERNSGKRERDREDVEAHVGSARGA